MKFLLPLFLLAAFGLTASPAAAGPFGHRTTPGTFGNGTITVPPEWAGIWSAVDTVYDCNGVFESTSSWIDTLCAGMTFEADTTGTCSGSATANSYQQTCDFADTVFADCFYTFHLEANGTRTGDSFFSVSTMTTTFSGTGKGCDFLPDSCRQINSHLTRIGPAPAAYCATPVQPTTWGQMKSRYR